MTAIPESTDLNEPVYKALLAEASELMLTAQVGDMSGAERLDRLANWLEAYEDRHHPRMISTAPDRPL